MSESNTQSEIRIAAINLLAMREHSEKELVEKLGRRFEQKDSILQAVKLLAAQNLQSDERFAEAFIRMRQRQGKGSTLIKMELRDRGIENELVSRLIDESDPSWLRLASEVRLKRFKAFPGNPLEKAKQSRFLHSRGFAPRHIQNVFSNTIDQD